ncbi:SVOP [Bugula neritina]|uniref:SVOP n=1 Tax=Bugula neritina TaxID=10212 RepID=A0A7J7JCR6_BUGNE|nr:SVOP [Bugula neritina]
MGDDALRVQYKSRRFDEGDRLYDGDLIGAESVEFDITNTRRSRVKSDDPNEFADNCFINGSNEDAEGDLGSTRDFSNMSSSASYRSMGNNQEVESEDTFTIEQAIEQLGYGKFQLKISCIAGLAWTADAIEMMVLSILSPALQCAWGLETYKQSLITSIVFVGMMVGSTLWGSLSDKYGRKFVLVVSAAFCMYFGILSALAVTWIWLLLFRCVVGFGVSGGSQAVTLYTEILPVKARAKSIVAIEIFWVLGSAFSTILAFIVMPTMGWRWLLAFSAIPLIIFIAACFWLPESMRFNLSRGHVNAAMKTLQECADTNKKPMPLGRLIAPPKQQRRGQISDLFTKEMRRTTFLLWIIWFSNTFCYYGIVLLTTELLDIQNNDVCNAIAEGHLPDVECALDCQSLTSKNYLELLWTTAAEVPGLVIVFFSIDIIGRKWSSASMFILFTIFIGLVAVCKGRIFMIIMLFAARCFISGSFQVVFVYTPEIYPTSCRAIGLGACSSMARFGAIITPFIAQVLLKKSIYATLAIYAVVAAAASIASLLLPVETKGKQLQESPTAVS